MKIIGRNTLYLSLVVLTVIALFSCSPEQETSLESLNEAETQFALESGELILWPKQWMRREPWLGVLNAADHSGTDSVPFLIVYCSDVHRTANWVMGWNPQLETGLKKNQQLLAELTWDGEVEDDSWEFTPQYLSGFRYEVIRPMKQSETLEKLERHKSLAVAVSLDSVRHTAEFDISRVSYVLDSIGERRDCQPINETPALGESTATESVGRLASQFDDDELILWPSEWERLYSNLGVLYAKDFSGPELGQPFVFVYCFQEEREPSWVMGWRPPVRLDSGSDSDIPTRLIWDGQEVEKATWHFEEGAFGGRLLAVIKAENQVDTLEKMERYTSLQVEVQLAAGLFTARFDTTWTSNVLDSIGARNKCK